MAQKSQDISQSKEQPKPSTSPTSSKKEMASIPSLRQTISPASGSGSSVLPKMSDLVLKREPSSSPSPLGSDKTNRIANATSAVKENGSSVPSPYGTRSRNRTGASRPNYAEDKDMEMDAYDVTDKSEKPKKGSRKSNPVASTQNLEQASTASPKPSAPVEDTKASVSQNGTKDPQQANAAPPQKEAAPSTASQSKKRKAAASQSTATSGQVQAATQSASTKKAASASHTNGAPNSLSARSSNDNDLANGSGYRETNLVTFENCKAMPNASGQMIADDGTVFSLQDHVYLICEPPGEPYYLARIQEWVHSKNDPKLPVEHIRVNWYYRPKDVGRKVKDIRMVLSTMHSDNTPLTSLRGKCYIKHRAEIADFAAFKRTPDSFWFEKLYDRFLMKNYDVIPVFQIVNVPKRVKKVLDAMWKYILVEQGRGKELTSAVKSCKRCSGYCASNDSVDCAVCRDTYHMNCVNPPLLKKPSRGFAWSCAACSRAQERKLEARNTHSLDGAPYEGDEDELVDEEEDGLDTTRTSPDGDEKPIPEPTEEQIRKSKLFPYRYLGVYCTLEDVFDYDDRTSPRSGTRAGVRHQANVLPWYGQPVEYVKPPEIKKSNRKDGKLTKEMQAIVEAERIKKENRPKWIQDEPAGYVERGGDDTATLLWQPPADCGVSMSSAAIDDYMDKAKAKASALKLPERSTNLQDMAVNVLYAKDFDPQAALAELDTIPFEEFGEPNLSPAEQKKFEEAVAKYGSELHSVFKHVKTVPFGEITRYYYTWKKTERGQEIWGNYSGRKGKIRKVEPTTTTQVVDEVADDADDSAFDTEKAKVKKKGFLCKFCTTKTSRQWRRAPNASVTLVTESGARANKEKGNGYVQALCRRCAELWRRYAIVWDLDEVAKKVSTSGRGSRRTINEDLYYEMMAVDEMVNNIRYQSPDASARTTPAANGPQIGSEPPRKKLKGAPVDKDLDVAMSDTSMGPATQAKKKEKASEKSTRLPTPEMPKPKTLPCAVCQQVEPLGDQHLSCKECRLAVHRSCYGILDNRVPGKWTCDMCANDKNPQVSIHYKCVLCPHEHTEHEFVEMPKPGPKKKTEKDRERERMEREAALKAVDFYRKKQEEMNRPVSPREPLKRTADNNWAHITCSVWTPEIKFGNAKVLAPSEGIPLIPRSKYGETCKICKKREGACVSCPQCKIPVHVECAHQAGHLLGFELVQTKSSRRDAQTTVNINGDYGTMAAGVWCKDHIPTKNVVYRMHDPVDDTGTNALQLYCHKYKQADLTLTGCARKANQIMIASKMMATATPLASANRRSSTTTVVASEREPDYSDPNVPGGKICLTCGVDVTPKWYPINQAQERELTNGHYGNLGTEAQKFVEQRSFQCHKCKKANRQPKPHLPPREPTPAPPEPEVLMAPIQPPPLISPPLPIAADARLPGRGVPYSWSPRMQTPNLAPPIPSPIAQPMPLQAPGMGPGPGTAPIPPMPMQSSVAAVVPPSIPPTRGPPLPTHYSSQPRQPYDWHRPPVPVHQSPVHHHRELSGGPPQLGNPMPPQLAPPLRPPPLSSLSHPPPPPPPMQNGLGGPVSYLNGPPPSPRRMSGPPPPPPPPQVNGPVYLSHSNHSLPEMRDHRIPPLVSPHVGPPDASNSLNVLRQWGPPHAPPPPPSHHGSPSMSRDGLPHLNRDHGLAHPPPPPPPAAPQSRPASGASASPSLRNLLS